MTTGPALVSILRQGDTLVASIHTALDDSEMVRFQNDLIAQIGEHRARGVIIDVARFPGAAFKGTGLGKTGWIILQITLTLFCNIGAVIMIFIWFFMKKPAVTNHVRYYGYGYNRQYIPPPQTMPPGAGIA